MKVRRPWLFYALRTRSQVRAVDRLEVLFAFAATTLAAIGIVSAVHFSCDVYEWQTRAIVAEAARSHTVEAVALQPIHQSMRRRPPTGRVQWFFGTATHEAVVAVDHSADRGERVRIWVDTNGTAIPAPRTQSDARGAAFGVGLALLSSVVSAYAIAITIVRCTLNGARSRAWDRSWLAFTGYGDGSRTPRRPDAPSD